MQFLIVQQIVQIIVAPIIIIASTIIFDRQTRGAQCRCCCFGRFFVLGRDKFGFRRTESEIFKKIVGLDGLLFDDCGRRRRRRRFGPWLLLLLLQFVGVQRILQTPRTLDAQASSRDGSASITATTPTRHGLRR